MKKKRILVISQYFYPEQFRINDICVEWIKRGYDVTVITGIPNYPKGKFYKGYGWFKNRKEEYKGVKIKRLKIFSRGNSSIKLILNYFSFVFFGFFWKVFTRINADYVFIFEVSPMTQALPGVWFAKKRKIPCYIYIQDLWPDSVEVVTGIKNKFILKRINKMVNYIYKRCTKIFATSESFVKTIHSRGVPKEKLIYWPQYTDDSAGQANFVPAPEIPNDGVFNIVFTGNIGQAQGLDILVDVASKLMYSEIDVKVRFNIIGDGRYKTELINKVLDRKVDKMFNFVERQPLERMPEFFASSDAAFISLKNDPLFYKTIPAKLQSYMSNGMPIIGSTSGEVDKIISEANCGLCSGNGDVETLLENITKLALMDNERLAQLGINAKNYCESNFDKEKLLNEMDKYLE